jgi:hydroquinone glucosyltransferase
MNATILAEEIGIAIKPVAEPGASLVGREEVERVVRLAILEGKEMRKKIEELKDSAAKAMEIGGSSYDSLACLAKEWKS